MNICLYHIFLSIFLNFNISLEQTSTSLWIFISYEAICMSAYRLSVVFKIHKLKNRTKFTLFYICSRLSELYFWRTWSKHIMLTSKRTICTRLKIISTQTSQKRINTPLWFETSNDLWHKLRRISPIPLHTYLSPYFILAYEKKHFPHPPLIACKYVLFDVFEMNRGFSDFKNWICLTHKRKCR